MSDGLGMFGSALREFMMLTNSDKVILPSYTRHVLGHCVVQAIFHRRMIDQRITFKLFARSVTKRGL